MLPVRVLNANVPWANFGKGNMQTVNCCVCGSPAYETVSSVVINWNEFFIVRCLECKLMWRNPMPDIEFLDSLYTEPYYNVVGHAPELVYQVGIPDFTRSDQEMRRAKSELEVRRWMDKGIMPTYADLSSQGQTINATFRGKRMLELGGGRGYLQQAADKVGWQTLGLEISPHGIKEAISKGLYVLPLPIEDFCRKYAPYPSYFDLIVFFDFLEHVTDPARVLRLLNYMLKDDGQIILRVPCTQSEPNLHLIDHIYHFTSETIGLLLSKEGFAIKEKFDSGVFKAPDGSSITNMTVIGTKVKPGSQDTWL